MNHLDILSISIEVIIREWFFCLMMLLVIDEGNLHMEDWRNGIDMGMKVL